MATGPISSRVADQQGSRARVAWFLPADIVAKVAAGRPEGTFDMAIAAHARGEGFTLVTNDLREFKRIDGLQVENWV